MMVKPRLLALRLATSMKISQKDSQKEAPVRKLLKGLNTFDGTNLTLISVDQDK